MIAGLSNMIVPVVGACGSGDKPQLIGTGIVVSPTTIVTCRHVIEASRILDPETGPRFTGRHVLCDSKLYTSTRSRASNKWDLCYLRFDSPLPQVTPAPLARVARLKRAELVAAGFQYDSPGPREHYVEELRVIQVERFEGWPQSAQFKGGVPAGFSGAPVLARVEDAWWVVGMLWLGGEDSATSRMVAVDPIVSFLSEERIDHSVRDLPGFGVASGEQARRVSIRIGRDSKNSVLEMNGDCVEFAVGRDFSDSVVRVNRRGSKDRLRIGRH